MTKPMRIVPRRPEHDFSTVPKYWFGGNVWATHMSNALNLLFPLGERFFMRSVKAYADEITDPQLKEQIRGFLAQEARHGLEHEAFFARLEEHGNEIQSFLAEYDRICWQTIEPRLPRSLRLAITVSLEHFTATFAHFAFTRRTLDRVHPTMQKLLRWHAAEEIEHKAVAFDLLQAVDPRYSTRVLGHAIATVGLLSCWWSGARHLMKQDPEATWESLKRGRAASQRAGAISLADIGRSFLAYLRPDYHPWHVDDYELAAAELAAQGMAAATAA